MRRHMQCSLSRRLRYIYYIGVFMTHDVRLNCGGTDLGRIGAEGKKKEGQEGSKEKKKEEKKRRREEKRGRRRRKGRRN